MDIDTRTKDDFEAFCERVLHTGRPAPNALDAYEKHIELINNAWAEVLEHPQSGIGLIIGKTGAGKTPSFMLDAIKKEMGFPQKELKHPNEINLEKVNAHLQSVEREISCINKQLAYQEGRRDELIRAKMYLESELKKDKEGKE